MLLCLYEIVMTDI